jgi:hypothetical protein
MTFFNRKQRRKSDTETLQYELGRYQKKVIDQGKEVQKLRDRVEVQEAQIKAANLFIATMAAQLAGGKVPSEGEIVIPKSELTAALNTQKVDWYEDKEADQVVIVLKIKEPELAPEAEDRREEAVSYGVQSDNQGEAGTEGDNDGSTGKESQELLVHTEEQSGSQETSEDK